MKVFIIILDFKGGKEISRCLKSLQSIKLPVNWQKEILVIDNNQKNLGFSAGANVGIKRALKNKAKAILLLNQDTLATKDFLFYLLKNKADVVGPIIKFKKNNKLIYDFGGKINWNLGKAWHRQTAGEIDYLSGCCLLIRQPVLEKIGLLDERFFLYYEDVDFCLRAKKVGFKIALEPKSVIFHELKNPKNRPFWQNWQLVKSHFLFLRKYYFANPLAYFYWLLISVKILLCSQPLF